MVSAKRNTRPPLSVTITYLPARPVAEKQDVLNNALFEGAIGYLRQEGISNKKMARKGNYAKIQV